MRLSPLSAALALALTASSAAQAQQFSRVISFGDSLTDAGNIALVDGSAATPVGNSFTTNNDSVYAQLLSIILGNGIQNNNTALVPSTAAGTNFAYGGACAISNGATIAIALPGMPTFTCANSPGGFSLLNQIGYHFALNGGAADPNALYTYWAGANDLLSISSMVTTYVIGGGNVANATAIGQTIAGQAALTAAGHIGALQGAGAKYIMVFNLPDLGLTPLNIGTGNQATASALSAIYNTKFNEGLATLQDGIIAINVYGIINEVKANPGAYGFTNTTGMACSTGPGLGGTPSSVACGPAGSGAAWTYAAGTNSSYLFADGVHPTGSAHALLANIAYATVTAPGFMSLAPEVAMQSGLAQNAAISDALDSEWAAGSEVGKLRGFAAIQSGQQDIEGSANHGALDGDSRHLNVGATYRMNDNATFGVAATMGSVSADVGNTGSFDGSSVLFGIFGQYEVNGLYARVGLSGGSTDMKIDRTIGLIASVRHETGSTGISQQIGTAEIGYVFKGDNFTHGPFIGLETSKTKVEAYLEDGTSATAMRFDEFSRDSNITRFGYQFTGNFESFKPFARVSMAKETNNDITYVRGGTASMPGNFEMAGFTPSNENGVDWNVGASFEFSSGFDGYVSYHAITGNEQQEIQSINIGIRKSF